MVKEKISLFGLGKLGLNMAACMAYKGYKVIGVDTNENLIDKLNKGEVPIYEPGLTELMEIARPNLSATTDGANAVLESDIIFIFVGTPSMPDGSFSSSYVEEAAKNIAIEMKRVEKYQLLVLRSTVMPGLSESILIPLIEKHSSKEIGKDFGFCFNPEFMALGTAIKDFLSPDVIAIGESNEEAGKQLENLYKNLCENDPPIVRTSLTNAEWSKISLNVFLTMKMSYANTIAEVCENINGGDSDKISEILGHDKRIGRKFLSGAVGYGGPCFPRDTRAFSVFAESLGCQAELSRASEIVNDLQSVRTVEKIQQIMGNVDGKIISILGLTYKPDTDIVEPSDSILIAKKLLLENAFLRVYDPAGIRNAEKLLGNKNVKYSVSAKECLSGSDICVIVTPWKEFNKLDNADFIDNMKSPVVIDCWRILRNKLDENVIQYYAIGLNR